MNVIAKFAMALAVCATVVGVSNPSHAASNWAELAWSDMRKLAPAGSTALGRTYTLSEVRETCEMLDEGISARNLLSGMLVIAQKSGRTSKQKQDMALYGISMMVVSGKRLCPRHLPAIWRAIND